jgi:hypothetical protein
MYAIGTRIRYQGDYGETVQVHERVSVTNGIRCWHWTYTIVVNGRTIDDVLETDLEHVPDACVCDRLALVLCGCKCGAMERERNRVECEDD